jgi:hypothetical protein
MTSDQEVVIFFFGLFWAAMTAGAARFRPFDSASALEKGGAAARRLVLAVGCLNIAPLICLWLALRYVACHHVHHVVFGAAVAALGLFGLNRIFAGIVLTWHRCLVDHWLYAKFEKNEEGITRKGRFYEASGLAHLISGFLWMVVCLYFARLITL